MFSKIPTLCIKSICVQINVPEYSQSQPLDNNNKLEQQSSFYLLLRKDEDQYISNCSSYLINKFIAFNFKEQESQCIFEIPIKPQNKSNNSIVLQIWNYEDMELISSTNIMINCFKDYNRQYSTKIMGTNQERIHVCIYYEHNNQLPYQPSSPTYASPHRNLPQYVKSYSLNKSIYKNTHQRKSIAIADYKDMRMHSPASKNSFNPTSMKLKNDSSFKNFAQINSTILSQYMNNNVGSKPAKKISIKNRCNFPLGRNSGLESPYNLKL